MDHFQGPERVFIEQARLGYVSDATKCANIEYEQSIIMFMDVENANAESYQTAFNQWVAHDVDHNVCPLDGYGTFPQNGGGVHFLHLFLCQEDKSLCQKKRIAHCLWQCMSAADIAKNRGITNIYPCSFSSKSGLTIMIKEVRDLYKPLALPPVFS